MSKTIWVQAADPNNRRTVLWETADEHPDGEVFVSGAKIVEVGKTAEVQRKLAKRILVEVDEPEPEVVSGFQAQGFGFSQDDEDNDDPLVAAVGNGVAVALTEAGYDSPERVQAATDDELLAVGGIGPKSLEKIREALLQSNPGDESRQQDEPGEQGKQDGSGEPSLNPPSQLPQQPSPSSLTPPVPAVPITPPSQQESPPQT